MRITQGIAVVSGGLLAAAVVGAAVPAQAASSTVSATYLCDSSIGTATVTFTYNKPAKLAKAVKKGSSVTLKFTGGMSGNTDDAITDSGVIWESATGPIPIKAGSSTFSGTLKSPQTSMLSKSKPPSPTTTTVKGKAPSKAGKYALTFPTAVTFTETFSWGTPTSYKISCSLGKISGGPFYLKVK
jgi:membrane-bound inhibitor of C-type lysozyme